MSEALPSSPASSSSFSRKRMSVFTSVSPTATPAPTPPGSPMTSVGSRTSSSPRASSRGPSVLTNFRGRNRFLTEETVQVQNLPHLVMTESNPFRSKEDVDDDNNGDEDENDPQHDDLISALSNDSLRRINRDYDPEHETSLPSRPPEEICVPNLSSVIPEWMDDKTDKRPYYAIKTQRPVPMPRLARHISAPVTHLKEIPELEFNSESFEVSLTNDAETQSLLGNRPRRRHIRGSSTTISVGSVVGQSSLKTSRTITTSSVVSEHSLFSHTIAAQKRLDALVGKDSIHHQQRHRQSVVKRELKYMLQAVSSPLRRMKQQTARGRANLKRSTKGCLT